MIDIIGHFFILYPILTLIKDNKSITKSILVKLLISMTILLIASILTNIYLMDNSLSMTNGRE